LTKLWYFT